MASGTSHHATNKCQKTNEADYGMIGDWPTAVKPQIIHPLAAFRNTVQATSSFLENALIGEKDTDLLVPTAVENVIFIRVFILAHQLAALSETSDPIYNSKPVTMFSSYLCWYINYPSTLKLAKHEMAVITPSFVERCNQVKRTKSQHDYVQISVRDVSVITSQDEILV